MRRRSAGRHGVPAVVGAGIVGLLDRATARTPEPGSALVYFLHDQHLVQAERRGLRTVQASLDLLAAGPSSDEAARGIDTAIAPKSITLDPTTQNSTTIEVAPGAEFATLTGVGSYWPSGRWSGP